MTKKTIIVLSILLLSVLAFASVAYAFSAFKTGEGPFNLNTTKIRTELCFTFNVSEGIPGETIILVGNTDENVIKKEEGAADYIYKISYEVAYNDGCDSDFITDLMLSADKTTDLGLIKAGDYDMLTRMVTYYGKHEGDEDLLLGDLLATFDVLKNPSMGSPFSVNAAITACQMTESAVKDMFGIYSTYDGGKYAKLFE